MMQSTVVAARLAAHQATMETALKDLFQRYTSTASSLDAAVQYAALQGGKRIRPLLVLESAALFGIAPDNAMPAALAVELIHCYSLVHDDLPAMDNSDLRRGKPTCHRQFDEATAILAGDTLLTLAFQVLAEADLAADIRCNLITAQAQAAGGQGMIEGQALDLAAEGQTLDLAAISYLQQRKTGALIEFSCTAGAILARASQAQHQALAHYARHLGLLFQITDDLLDHHGNSATMGKNTGQDRVAGKATFVSLLGVHGAAQAAAEAVKIAQTALQSLPVDTSLLQDVLHFVLHRTH